MLRQEKTPSAAHVLSRQDGKAAASAASAEALEAAGPAEEPEGLPPPRPDRSSSHMAPVSPLDELFPPSRVKKIFKLDPECPKMTATAARVMNVAAVMILQRLAKTARASSRVGRATLKQEDILATIRRGDGGTKFFQGLTYALDDEETNEPEDVLFPPTAALVESQDSSAAAGTLEDQPPTRGGISSSMRTSRKHACIGRSGGPQKKRCADITSFFRPRQSEHHLV